MYRAIAVLTLAATPLAADLITIAGIGYVGVSDLQQGTVSASIPTSLYDFDVIKFTAGAAANAGYLDLGTSATFSTMNGVPPPEDGSASATALSEDVLTPLGGMPGAAGFLDYTFALTGSNSAVLTGFSPFGVGTSVGASFTNLLVCTAGASQAPVGLGCPFFDVVAHVTSSSLTNAPFQVEIPITFGQPIDVVFELFSTTGARFDHTVVVNFDGSSDFFDTAQITSIDLLDANHQPISSPGLLATSGTIYPLNGTSAIPEPNSLLFLLSSAALLFTVRRKK